MILANRVLTKAKLESATIKGVTIFLYNEIEFTPLHSGDVRLINCTIERTPSTWFTWKENDKIIQLFKRKFPFVFQWGLYDMSLAFQKAIYWANQKTGFLHYVIETKFPNESIFEIEPLHPYTPWKILVKYLIETIHRNKKTTKKGKYNFRGKKGVFIGNEFQLTIYKYILNYALECDDFVILTTKKTLAKRLSELGFEKTRIGLFQAKGIHKVPFINPLRLKENDWFVLNQLLIHWTNISEWFSVAEQIAETGITSFLMNEGENGIFGAVMGEIMGKNGITTYNTMNGMKAGQAQDAFINFDYWFVWDEDMKKLLMNKCYLPEQKLLVSGHLMEDEVNGYQYSGSLDLSEKEIENRTVISLFSVRGKREEKISTFQYLYQLASNRSDILLLVRPHPSETIGDNIPPPKGLDNVKWINFNQNNSKQTLYDQLSISKLSICFGSTVALESKWFGIPCITVEMRKESSIYAVDGETIVKTEKLTDSLFNELLNHAPKVKGKKTATADFIINALKN
ncbi:MAG: hypothetical protein M9933_15800 [Chitinophagaceae bacterium]|nr:hypothetical protein [Chitinophagaceae bacterium]